MQTLDGVFSQLAGTQLHLAVSVCDMQAATLVTAQLCQPPCILKDALLCISVPMKMLTVSRPSCSAALDSVLQEAACTLCSCNVNAPAEVCTWRLAAQPVSVE